MSTARLSFDDLYSAIQRLDPGELERFVARVIALHAQRSAPHLSARETELLQTINRGLPPAGHQRYEELMERRRRETLTPAEHQELLQLTEEAERLQAERVEALAELARLRGLPLASVVEQLGLAPGSHA
ncbi:MAG TPA: STAS/SEC14 domain-containing protein [Thermoanaerobaculia bacterium]|nr:STAS/SEC14 domain-containing protein [Thermoanaerobaculia bacterium]